MAKAVFGARGPSPAAVKSDKNGQSIYTGPERRMAIRRSGMERRANLRFEADTSDRRSNHGRRRDDPAPKPW